MSALVVKGLYVAFFASSFVLIATQSNSDSGFSSSGSGGVACGNGEAEQCGTASGAGIEENLPTESETNVSECDQCVFCFPGFVEFLGVHPCIITGNITVDIQRCDVFVASSTMIAQNMLPWGSRCINVLFTILRYAGSPLIDSYGTYVQSTLPAFARAQGFVGPSSTYAAVVSEEVRNQFSFPMITYSPPSELLSEQRNAYSTASSVHFLNKVRLQLLKRHDWYKFGIVATSEESFSNDAEQLALMASKNSSNSSTDEFEIHFPGSYTISPDRVLEQLKDDDVRIFIAMLSHFDARNLMCTAYHLNLTTQFHVWILPGFYDPLWWKPSDDNRGDSICTDEQMLEAINSTLFVDVPVVQPYNITYLDNVYQGLEGVTYQRIINVTERGYPTALDDLDEQLVNQSFFHSRAMSNIDAYLAMERAWNYTYRELCLTRDNYNITLDEVCNSIHPNNNPGEPPNMFVQLFEKNLRNGVFCGFSGVHILDLQKSREFGQGMITQFGELGETECLVGVYMNFYYSQEQCSKVYFDVSELDLSTMQNFSFTFASESNAIYSAIPFCTNFTWKGRSTAPSDGRCVEDSCKCYSQVGIAAWISSGVVAVAGVVVSIALLVFNYVFRTNKHLKASSPRLNIIILVACILIYPVPFLVSVEFSGKQLIKDDHQRERIFPILCEVRRWIYFLSIAAIIGTLFVRNWRLYRIFYNRRIKEQKCLSDYSLIILLFAIMMPVFLLLFFWTVLHGYQYVSDEIPYDCPGLDIDDSLNTSLVEIVCRSDYGYIWETLIVVYTIGLSLGLLFMSYQNSKVSSHIAQEGEFAAKMTLLSLSFLLPTYIIVLLITQLYGSAQSANLTQPAILFWDNFVFVLLFASSVLGALFIPKLIFIQKDHRDLKRKLHHLKTKQRASNVLESKKDEINRLKLGLRMREEQINSVLTSMSRRMTGFSVSSMSSVSTGGRVSVDDRTRLTTLDSVHKSGSGTPPISPASKRMCMLDNQRNSFDSVFLEDKPFVFLHQ